MTGHKRIFNLLLATVLFVALPCLAAQRRTLDIYWVDVEGGAATLIVTPAGESLLVDTGWRKNDRDAQRIFNVAKAAGLKKIDYLIVTHYHADHVGGVGRLSAFIPIERFLDHGDTVETGSEQAREEWSIYQRVSKGRRSQPALGQKIPLKGVDVTVLAANGNLIPNAVNGGGPNDPALCSNPVLKKTDNGENGRSVGFLLRYGKFRYLSLGDLTWNKEIEMVCPTNRIGTVDLYQLEHHGMDMSGAPQILNSVRARVAVMNNGPRKGGIGSYLDTVKNATGLEDLWQLHFSFQAKPEQNTEAERIANLEEEADCQGYYIKASIEPSGRFTVINTRNNFSKTYAPR